MFSIRNHDWLLTIVTWIIVIVGIITIYSITYNSESAIYGAGAFNRQIIFAILGLGIYVLIGFFSDYTYLKNRTILSLVYAVVVGLLIAVLVIAQVNRGSQRWIPLGPINIEPSELAKILVILLASSLLTLKLEGKINRFLVIGGLSLLAIPMALVFLQPDLSTTLSIGFIVAMMALSAAVSPLGTLYNIAILIISVFTGMLLLQEQDFFNIVRLDWFFNAFSSNSVIVGSTLAVLSFGMVFLNRKSLLISLIIFFFGLSLSFGFDIGWNNALSDYQKERIETFVDPQSDPRGAGYQVNQSLIATGAGQILGLGFGRGTQSNLNFLPERHTDFIFASYAEEFGFLGSATLIIAYLILISRIVFIGVQSREYHGFLICIGVASMILIQFMINIGMNIGIMPVTGIPLPLFSFGGSSLITTLAAIALVQNIAIKRNVINTDDSLLVRD